MREATSNRSKALILLAFGVVGINFGLAIYQSTYTNFLVSDLNIEAFEMGVLESIREVPGLLSAFILGSLLRFPQSLLASGFLFLFGFGLGGVSTVTSWIQVILWSLVWSIGFHIWTPLLNSITLNLSEPGSEGKRLGQINSISSIAAFIAMGSVTVFSSLMEMQYRLFFLVAGVVAVIGGFMVLRIPRKLEPFSVTRFVFRRRYSIYYILSFFEGARRQMFLTFAPFALVKVYGLDVTLMALLLFVSRVFTFGTSPYLGKLVDRIGPRTMLMTSYVLMICDFLGYILIQDVFALSILYILNTILMIVSRISRITYMHDIAPITDLTQSLAMGQTIEHIAAVILPLTGGIMWDMFGYEVTFLLGLACAVALLLTSRKIRSDA